MFLRLTVAGRSERWASLIPRLEPRRDCWFHRSTRCMWACLASSRQSWSTQPGSHRLEMIRHPFQHRALRCLTLLLCAASPLFAQSPQGASGKLKFVIIFSRHGVRTPAGSSEQLNQYSAQPWPKWDSPSGNLTDQGATLMTLFGGYYRAYLAQREVLSASGCADATRVSFFSDS